MKNMFLVFHYYFYILSFQFQNDDVRTENWHTKKPRVMNWLELSLTDYTVLGKVVLLKIVEEDVNLILDAWDLIWIIIEMSVKEWPKTRKIIYSIWDLVVVYHFLKPFAWKVSFKSYKSKGIKPHVISQKCHVKQLS